MQWKTCVSISSRTPISEDSTPTSPEPMISTKISLDSIHSPFFLESCYNSNVFIISEVLYGTRYDNYSITMIIALDAKNKLTFIDETIERLNESHHHYRIWSRCNLMVKSWLLSTISKHIYKSILRFNDISQIWKDLLDRFHITNLPMSY